MEIKNISIEDRENLISIAKLLRRESYKLTSDWLLKFVDRIKGED